MATTKETQPGAARGAGRRAAGVAATALFLLVTVVTGVHCYRSAHVNCVTLD
jgi:hypothetical protein